MMRTAQQLTSELALQRLVEECERLGLYDEPNPMVRPVIAVSTDSDRTELEK